MESYDLAMIMVLIGATLFGAWKGMAWQIASLASLVLSYFVSLRFSEPLAPHFGDQAPWNRFLAMFALYIGTSLFVWMLFRIVAGAIDRVKLKEFDRQLGAMFGLAKGVLLCVAITFFAVTLAPSFREQILNSRSGHYIGELIHKADSVAPPEIHAVIEPYLNRLEERIGPDAVRNAQRTTDQRQF